MRKTDALATQHIAHRARDHQFLVGWDDEGRRTWASRSTRTAAGVRHLVERKRSPYGCTQNFGAGRRVLAEPGGKMGKRLFMPKAIPVVEFGLGNDLARGILHLKSDLIPKTFELATKEATGLI